MQHKFGGHVLISQCGHVAVITICRPPHNFVGVEFMRELADAFDAADQDPAVRASVLQADGKSFSAGADFSGSQGGPASGGASELYAHAVLLYSVRQAIECGV